MVARRAAAPRPGSIRSQLSAYAEGERDDILRLDDLLVQLDRSAFGMLLLIATLPAFIPLPVGGAVSGPLAMLIGAQLTIGMHRPWLPRFLGKRGPKRGALITFNRRLDPWLARLERLVRPRLQTVFQNRIAVMLTGALVFLTGSLLSLPIPLTNYLFGGLLLLFAIALIERDGVSMIVAWVGAATTIAVSGVLSGSLTQLFHAWIDRLA